MDVKLIMFKPNGQQKAIPLTQSKSTIGRSPECDLRIPVESCSRMQCELLAEEGKLVIRDLGSSNGTFVNNQRIDQAQLSAGDRLTIGPVTLTVQIDGQPSEISPAAESENEPEELIPMEDALDTAPADDDPIAALEALADEIQE